MTFACRRPESRFRRDGVATVEQTREAFERIGHAVEDMTARITEIAASAQELARTAESLQALVGRFTLNA